MTTLQELQEIRPPREEVVKAHQERMQAEQRVYQLRELRKKLALTQTDIAKTLGVSQNRISDLERGEIAKSQIDTLNRYVTALGGTLKIEIEIGDHSFRLV